MIDEIISKAELARVLGRSRARISQLCNLGLPVRPDGKLDRGQAVAWVKVNIDPWRGGWGDDERRSSKVRVH